MLRLWEKDRQFGDGLLSEMRWEGCEAASFPSREQVIRLAPDLRDEARQAQEDDTENRMTTWTDYGAACNWCKGVDNEKIVMVQRDDGTHSHR